jgi:hypothetical protein
MSNFPSSVISKKNDTEFYHNYQNQTFCPVLNLLELWTAFRAQTDYQNAYVCGKVSYSCTWNQCVLMIGFTTVAILHSSSYYKLLGTYGDILIFIGFRQVSGQNTFRCILQQACLRWSSWSALPATQSFATREWIRNTVELVHNDKYCVIINECRSKWGVW